jgi:glyoxylase I family protein
MLRHFEHVGMTVGNLDRCLGFYCGLLGLTLLRRRATPAGGEVAFLYAGGGQLEIVCPPGGAARARPVPATEAGLRHLTFCVDDVAADFARLEAAGVEVVERPRPAHLRDVFVRVAFVADPDGNVVELVERAGPA